MSAQPSKIGQTRSLLDEFKKIKKDKAAESDYKEDENLISNNIENNDNNNNKEIQDWQNTLLNVQKTSIPEIKDLIKKLKETYKLYYTPTFEQNESNVQKLLTDQIREIEGKIVQIYKILEKIKSIKIGGMNKKIKDAMIASIAGSVKILYQI